MKYVSLNDRNGLLLSTLSDPAETEVEEVPSSRPSCGDDSEPLTGAVDVLNCTHTIITLNIACVRLAVTSSNLAC